MGGGLLVRREDASQVWTATQTLEGLGKSCGGKGGGDKDGELHLACLLGLDGEVQEKEEEKVNGTRQSSLLYAHLLTRTSPPLAPHTHALLVFVRLAPFDIGLDRGPPPTLSK